jgi:hypothetical protein
MICIYIYVYLIITHDEDMHRQGTTSNQKTEPMPAGELEGSIPGFCAVLRYCMDWKQALKGKINAVFRH